ncbi:MAG: FKBP-type peptidyl-prolyl cis-trans isomerase [Bacteroidales bacterium]|nr:FKBP-type peptidyl-prolyl cis-trans isomerase [Bacteroidales bacterium]
MAMNRKTVYAVMAAVILSGGCMKQSLEQTYLKQEGKIDTYVSSTLAKDESYTVTYNNGSVRITLVPGDGPELEKDGVISFYYAGYTFTGSISNSSLFATNHEETASSARWTVSGDDAFQVITADLSSTDFVEGLENGLAGVKAGEECMILFSGKHGFGRRAVGTIPANSALAYHVWVSSISND